MSDADAASAGVGVGVGVGALAAPGVRAAYAAALTQRGYTADAAQLAAVDALERCEQGWADYKAKRRHALGRLLQRPPLPRGVYLWGGVGRGKSFLMDCFYDAVPLKRKTRLHFHEFMREVHRELLVLRGTVDPLQELGRRIARRHRLICFDEFHVADVTDAMVLHRLLDALFAQKVGIVTTSNFHPDGLYPNGLHRDRILPAIALLKQQLEIVNVDAGRDYRDIGASPVAHYLTPLGPATDAALAAVWARLADRPDGERHLRVGERSLVALQRAGDAVWFDFGTLCGSARSQNDYLELATSFRTVVLSGVPRMEARDGSPARRFTWLVDVLYDRRVQLIVSAEVQPELLYLDGPLAHEFPRTVSRLHEMQSDAYARTNRRDVDTALT